MKRTVIIAGLLALLIVPVSGHAYTDTRDHDSEEDTAIGKFGRGLAAMTTGVLELPGNIVAETRERNPAVGMTLGFAKGIGMIPVRELVGVFNFVTAPIEVPSGYRPILNPEYPWQYFDGARSASLDPSVRD